MTAPIIRAARSSCVDNNPNMDLDDKGTPKEQLLVLRRNDLKPELRGLLSEPQFRSFQSLLFTLVENGFAVWFSLAKQVKDDARQLVGSRSNRLRLAELACDAPEELPQVVFSMVERLRAHTQRSSNSTPNASAFGAQHLASADFLLRGQA
jgi:hypothetical protein